MPARTLATRLPSPTSESRDPDIKMLLDGNRRWVAKRNAEDPEYFARVAKKHAPHFLYLGCSDARVAADRITNVGPGKLFIHRNIANCVVGTDLNFLSVLQCVAPPPLVAPRADSPAPLRVFASSHRLRYAVMALDVKHIIVVGHYDCGGIRASMSNNRLGIMDSWLQHIRDVYRTHANELDAIPDKEVRHRRFVELHAIEQCLNLYKTGIVQSKRLETFKDPKIENTYPRVHAMVFDPADGVLHKLPVNFQEHIRERRLHGIYDLLGDAREELNSVQAGEIPPTLERDLEEGQDSDDKSKEKDWNRTVP